MSVTERWLVCTLTFVWDEVTQLNAQNLSEASGVKGDKLPILAGFQMPGFVASHTDACSKNL